MKSKLVHFSYKRLQKVILPDLFLSTLNKLFHGDVTAPSWDIVYM